MTEQNARRSALQRARETRSERFVIWSIEETDTPGQHYHVATEYDLDTYYQGSAEPIACYGPSGLEL